jgi:hypothetical protein
MEDMPTEAGFSIGNNRLELGSPVSNLDYIAEEHFHSRKPGKSFNSKTDDDDVDSESGIHIPDVKSHGLANSPELTRQGIRLKSQTLPLPGHSGSKHHFPFRSHTFRSIALPQFIKDRTKSFEHISNQHKDFRISHEHRSHSFHFHLKSRHKGDSHKHKSESQNEKSVINNNNSIKSIDAAPRRSSSMRHVKEESSHIRPRSSSEYSSTHTSAKQSSSVEHMDKTKPDNKVESSQKDVVLKIVEPGDDGYKVEDAKPEDKKTVTDRVEAGRSIRISVTDTDSESPDAELNNQNQFEQNKSSDKTHGNESNVLLDSTENVCEQSSNDDGTADGGASKRSDVEKDERCFRKISIMKEERSSSSDSSKTSKSRTESFTTDSTTSGVGSYDSGHHGVIEFPSLSPIASSNSLETMDVQLRHKEKKELKDNAHHSSFLRRMSNLTRVPSIRRQSSPGVGLMPTSKYFDFSENAIMYTTARDAIGYATLRNLMKTRTISSDVESDYGLNSLYDNMGSMTSINRRPSIDSTITPGRPSR